MQLFVNFIVKLWPHMYGLRHSNSWTSGGKGRTEKLWSKYGRERNFHIPKKLEIANFNS